MAHTAADGAAGLQIFDSRLIDAVVLDYIMPKMDGAAVTAEIKKINPKVPVIMVSAYPNIREKVSHLVDAFIVKGDDPEILLQTLQSLLPLPSAG